MRNTRSFILGLLFTAAFLLVGMAMVHLRDGYVVAFDSFASGELGVWWSTALALAMTCATAPKFYAAYRALKLAVNWKPTA